MSGKLKASTSTELTNPVTPGVVCRVTFTKPFTAEHGILLQRELARVARNQPELVAAQENGTPTSLVSQEQGAAA